MFMVNHLVGFGAGYEDAFPSIDPALTADTSATLTSPFNVNLPSGSGGMLFAIVFRATAGQTFTFPAGWTQLTPISWASGVLTAAWKMADGTEGATISVTSSTATSQQTLAHILRIANAANQSPEEATGTTGTNLAPDSGSVTPSWGSAKTLFISCWGMGTNGSPSAATPPANYTDYQKLLSSGVRGLGIAARLLLGTTDDPGVWSVTTGNATNAWGAKTFAVKPV